MAKIIILTNKLNEGIRLKNTLAEIDSTFVHVDCLTKEDLHADMDCQYIFSTWYMPVFSEQEVVDYFPNLKAIFYAAGTVKSFAGPFLRNGVRVFSATQANGVPVAEFTVSQIILANKGYFQAARRFRRPIWRRAFGRLRRFAESHTGNYESVVGLLGCGAVGSKVVELLQAYDITVKVYDPFLSKEREEELGVKNVSLDEIFETADIVSNHLPDIPETKNIIDSHLLSKMKPFATLINTGRGAQIDESALNTVFRKRKDLTALLDVTVHEPPFPWSPLYWRKNIFLTPHLAGSLSGEVGRMIRYVYDNYCRLINGDNVEGEVFQQELDTKA